MPIEDRLRIWIATSSHTTPKMDSHSLQTEGLRLPLWNRPSNLHRDSASIEAIRIMIRSRQRGTWQSIRHCINLAQEPRYHPSPVGCSRVRRRLGFLPSATISSSYQMAGLVSGWRPEMVVDCRNLQIDTMGIRLKEKWLDRLRGVLSTQLSPLIRRRTGVEIPELFRTTRHRQKERASKSCRISL